MTPNERLLIGLLLAILVMVAIPLVPGVLSLFSTAQTVHTTAIKK